MTKYICGLMLAGILGAWGCSSARDTERPEDTDATDTEDAGDTAEDEGQPATPAEPADAGRDSGSSGREPNESAAFAKCHARIVSAPGANLDESQFPLTACSVRFEPDIPRLTFTMKKLSITLYVMVASDDIPALGATKQVPITSLGAGDAEVRLLVPGIRAADGRTGPATWDPKKGVVTISRSGEKEFSASLENVAFEVKAGGGNTATGTVTIEAVISGISP